MKLRRLELTAYGLFSDARIDLRPDARLHLIVGPNEAGKTTRRAAIADLLYGFEHRSDYAFRYENAKLRVSARIEANGTIHEVVRRKGRGQTLYDHTDTPVDRSIVASWLGGIDRDTYVKLGSISHDELKEGARILLEDEGAVASALFGAATGGFNAREFLEKLQADAAALFKPGGQNPPLNVAIKAFEDAMTRCREMTTSSAKWKDLTAKITELENDALKSGRRVSEFEGRLAVLRRLHELIPSLNELDSSMYALNEFKKSALFPSESVAAVRDLLRQISDRRDELDEKEKQLTELRKEQEQERSRFDPLLLEAYAEITTLAQDVGVVRKADDDLVNNCLLRKRDEAKRKIDAALARTWPGASLNEVLEHQTVQEALPQARQMLRRHGKLAAAVSKTEGDLSRTQEGIESDRAELERLGPANDLASLEATLAEVDRAGRVDLELEQLVISIAARNERLAVDLRALGIALDDPLACRTFALPLPATLERFRVRFSESKARSANAAQAWQAARAAVDARRSVMKRTTDARLLSSEEELSALRADRDRAFDTVTTAPPAALDASLVAYRTLLMRSDVFADERFARAAEIGAATAEMREFQREEAELADLEAQRGTLARECSELEAEWSALRTSFLADVGTPEEALERVARFTVAVTLAQGIMELHERREQLVSMVDRLVTALERVLAADLPPDRSLGVMISFARAREKVLRASDVERHALERRLREKQASLVAVEAAAKDAVAALTGWKTEWEVVVSRLRLGAPLDPEDAEEVFDAFGKLFENLHLYSNDNARINGIEKDRDAFLKEAEALIERCALSRLLDFRRDPFKTIDELHISAGAAHDIAVRNEEREKGIRRRIDDIAHVRERLEGLVRRRDVLLVPLHISPDEADEVLSRQVQHDELQRTIERLQGDIRAAMRREPEEVAGDLATYGGVTGLEYEIEGLIAELAQEKERHRSAFEECGAERDRQKRIRASHEAVEAHADAMAIGSEIDRYARRYAALTVARLILAERMEAYAAAHQGPVIAAASRYLAVMTLERYPRVRIIENEAGVPVLNVVERDGGEKAIEALSEGTKDQLYLALRLATLEDRLHGTCGPPLLLDDTLKNFDDARTVAALRALGDFSKSAQVLYFTPRSIVVDLARQALGDGVDVIELGVS